MKVGFVYDPIYLKHDTGQHPENANRLKAIMRFVERTGPWQQLVPVAPNAATIQDISLVHDRKYISYIREFSEKGGGQLTPDTVISSDSYEATYYAVGGVIKATNVVIDGELDSVFALVRPPGHHATAGHAMGFCLFNNVAIAAKYALKNYGLERIAIIDFDVHHGNGTQETFYNEPKVLYLSTHQYPHYPGTGSIDETGGGQARGTIVNIPLPAGCGDDEYQKVFEQIVVPIVRRFNPQFIIVSAGYDAHWTDELSMMQVTITGFGRITRIIKEMAGEMCGGRMVLSLEGGYNLTALSSSVRATFDVLVGNTDIADKLGKSPLEFKAPDINSLIERLMEIHSLP
jgi:acetoin utilization deacetylase AcuC-like enzyme